jgi:hypothetical protein
MLQFENVGLFEQTPMGRAIIENGGQTYEVFHIIYLY